jgi:NAD-dependent deacetylase
VDLENMGKLKWVLTQNIDGLHQRAGSRRVSELHGSPATVSCLRCGFRVSWDQAMELRDETSVPRCPHDHPLKPDIVLFEEQLPTAPFERAHLALAQSDLLLCLGTSLVVHPVAGLPALMRRGGGDVAIITGSSTPEDDLAEVKLTDPLEEVLPAAVAMLRGL